MNVFSDSITEDATAADILLLLFKGAEERASAQEEYTDAGYL